MAWNVIEGEEFPSWAIANSVGLSLDQLLNTAMSMNNDLSTAIHAIKTSLDDGLDAIGANYSVTLDTTTVFADPGALPNAPNYASLFDADITKPTAPTLADAPTIADPNPAFPTAPTLTTEPTLSTAPTLANIVAAFPTMDSLPVAPTLGAAPDLDDLPAMATTPTAPGLNTLLDATAYSGAFALDRDQIAATETAELWAVEYGAAANGIGLPTAAMLAAQGQIRQKKRQALSESAKKQAQLQAEHLREDLRWAYDARIKYWSDIESATLTRWREEQNLRLTSWIQTTSNQMELYAKQANVITQVFQTGTQAEQSRITALIANETMKLESWIKQTTATLDFWAKPSEVKSELYQTQTQAESARIQAINAYQGLLVESWAKTVQSKLDEYKALGMMEIDATKVSNEIVASRLQSEGSRLVALLQGYQANLQREAEKRAWWAASNDAQLRKAEATAADSRALQEIALKTGQDAITAYAAALAEQFKALLAAASYRASTDAGFNVNTSTSMNTNRNYDYKMTEGE